MVKKILNAFQAAGCDNLQFFPAIINSDGKVNWDNYFAINVLCLISAADLFLSKSIKISERPSGLKFLGFQDLVIDPKKAQGFFFRLAENPLEIIVHERILDYLSENSPLMDGESL